VRGAGWTLTGDASWTTLGQPYDATAHTMHALSALDACTPPTAALCAVACGAALCVLWRVVLHCVCCGVWCCTVACAAALCVLYRYDSGIAAITLLLSSAMGYTTTAHTLHALSAVCNALFSLWLEHCVCRHTIESTLPRLSQSARTPTACSALF
jgi:hypothetical protein